jgi:hypothetical protein
MMKFWQCIKMLKTHYMKTHHVFISYSSKEKNIADAVCHKLEESGIKYLVAS